MNHSSTSKPLILHPTDFSPASEVALAYAVHIALARQTGLKILHVGDMHDEVGEQWKNFPRVLDLLVDWGLLDNQAKPTEVYDRLGLSVQSVEKKYRSVLEGIVDYGNNHAAGIDMLVLHTEGRKGLPRWLQPSTAETVSRDLGFPAVFVRGNQLNAISVTDGTMSVSSILVPVDHSPDSAKALAYLLHLLSDLKVGTSKLVLLHVGEQGEFPDVTLPAGLEYEKRTMKGDPVDAILSEASSINADLLVMATQGHDGFLDVLRGNTSERVLRAASCPVLTIPLLQSNPRDL